MEQQIEGLQGLLVKSAEELETAQAVISELAQQNQELGHALASRDLAIQMAAGGQVPMSDLPEKVAEFEGQSGEDLELTAKVASMQVGPGHTLHESGGQSATTDAMSFING